MSAVAGFPFICIYYKENNVNMEARQQLVITLPETMAELPILIVKNSGPKKIVLSVHPEKAGVSFIDEPEREYAFIWRQSDYVKVAFKDILWVKADGSYSTFHLTRKRDMTVSFNLAVVEKELPASEFIRIHRSCIVNLRHVESLIGNSVKVEDTLLTIGREFRERLLSRFVFIGVRRSRK